MDNYSVVMYHRWGKRSMLGSITLERAKELAANWLKGTPDATVLILRGDVIVQSNL